MVTIFKKRPIRARGIVILSLTLFIILMMWFADYPNAVERYYSQGFYPVICHIFHPVFNLFPFSVGDIVYIIVVVYLIYALVRLIRLLIKRQWKPAWSFVLGIAIGTEIAIIAFYLFWGLNYYRPSAAERLNLQDSTYTLADLKATTSTLIDSANACRARVSAAELGQANKVIYKTAINAVNQLTDSSAVFKTYSPDIKSSVLTPLLNYLGTSGYYNPFTSESQMNYQMPVYVRPFVACHELSHQMGFGPEDEANYVGFMAGTHSKDKLLRYSSYYIGVQEFMFALKMQDSLSRKELRKKISPEVLADFKQERQYWLAYEGKIETISSIFYDNFLKANNQPQGLKTYNRMVLLVLAYRKKHQL
ncbi:MAG: DUF3810 domain-containing protein [Sphingobacteriales bacterium]